MDSKPTYDTLLKIRNLLSHKNKKENIMNDEFCDIIDKWYKINWCKHPIISMILYEVVKCEQIQQNHVTKILETIEKWCPADYKYLKWFWLDTAIKNGYVLLNTQNKKLARLQYTKSYLLLKPQNATSSDIEDIFADIVIVHNIFHYKLSNDIKKFIKRSKHDVTLQCIKNCLNNLELLCNMDGYKPYSNTSLIDNFLDFFAQLTNFGSGVAGYIIRKYCLMAFSCIDDDGYIDNKRSIELNMYYILINYSKHNIKITFDDIISFCTEENDEEYYYAALFKTAPEIIKALLEHFDTTEFVLTDTHVKQIFSLTNKMTTYDTNLLPVVLRIFKTFQKKYEYKFSQELFEYAFINCNYVLFDIIVHHHSFKCTPICVDYAFKYSSEKFIQYLLENKIYPTEKHIEMIFYNDKISTDIIRLFRIFGIKIPDRLKEIYTIKCKKILLDFDLSDSTNYRLFSLITYFGDNAHPYANLKEFTPMQILRQNFAFMAVEDIIEYIDNNKLTPDIYCFENTLIHGNTEMFHYSCDHYNYVPTLPIIIMCPDKYLALVALYKFYPELAKGFNIIEEPDNIKKLLINCPKLHNDDDSDDDGVFRPEKLLSKIEKLLSKIDGYELGDKYKSIKTESILNDDKKFNPIKKKHK